MPDTPLLHVYSQRHQHDEAYLIGNRLGLERLQAAITQALQTGQRATAQARTSDGEGYEILAQLDNSPWDLRHPWGRRAVPYTTEHAKEQNPQALWPWDQEPHLG